MAIAFDSTTTSSLWSSVTSITFAHTCTGSDRMLFVATANNTGANITGVTYNGVAMTQISTINNSAPSKMYFWYLIAPASGSNNVVVTASGTCSIIAKSVSYTGVKQSGQPDATVTNWPTTTTSWSQSVTTVADNCWIVMSWMWKNGSTVTAGANTFIRSSIEVLLAWLFLADTNALQTPAWSKTLNVTSASQEFTGIMASFSPSVTSTTNSSFLAFM